MPFFIINFILFFYNYYSYIKKFNKTKHIIEMIKPSKIGLTNIYSIF